MNQRKFDRIVKQLGIDKTKGADAAKMVIVGGKAIKTAAAYYGVSFQCVWKAVKTINSTQVDFTEVEQFILNEDICPPLHKMLEELQ